MDHILTDDDYTILTMMLPQCCIDLCHNASNFKLYFKLHTNLLNSASWTIYII